MRARFAARDIAKRRALALIGESLRQRSSQQRRGMLGVVLIVSVGFTRNRGVGGVVCVVVPLRAVARFQQARFVAVVLDHQVNGAIDAFLDRACELSQETALRVIVDFVDRIETQAVEAIFFEPVQRVFDEELAYRLAVVVDDVDRRAPGRGEAVGVKDFTVRVQIISFGAKMVVHDVEKDGQSSRVRRDDECFEVLGRPVVVRRRKREDSVVSPIPRPRNVRERHQLDRRHAERREVIELRLRGRVRSFGRKRPSVQFVEDVLVPRAPIPRVVRPRERARVDDDACLMDALRLKARSRIGNEQLADREAVARPGPRIGAHGLEPAVGAALEGDAPFAASAVVEQVGALVAGRVETKADTAIAVY